VFLNPLSKNQEQNMVVSIVYTLTSFDTVSGVSITVNGSKVKTMPYETDISGVLTRKNVMINADQTIVTQGYAKFDSYMWIKDEHNNKWCIPISKQVEVMTVEDQAYMIFDSMNNLAESFETALPVNARLEECKYSANTVILDFNSNLLNYSGLEKEMEMISQIYLAAKQIDGVENVILRCEGKKVKLKEGTDISSGLFLADHVNRIDR
jgi:spore germination protein GerM